VISKERRQSLLQKAQFRCGYCLTQEVVSGISLTVEHLVPKSSGGTDDEENLWISCRLCNEAKGIQRTGVDPTTQQHVPLFNPRTEIWLAHFAWDEDGTHILGLTEIGRATVNALSLNSELRVRSRALWVEAGYHPPE
jgi:hypothetical protein